MDIHFYTLLDEKLYNDVANLIEEGIPVMKAFTIKKGQTVPFRVVLYHYGSLQLKGRPLVVSEPTDLEDVLRHVREINPFAKECHWAACLVDLDAK
jgi:hypothetical protein